MVSWYCGITLHYKALVIIIFDSKMRMNQFGQSKDTMQERVVIHTFE